MPCECGLRKSRQLYIPRSSALRRRPGHGQSEQPGSATRAVLDVIENRPPGTATANRQVTIYGLFFGFIRGLLCRRIDPDENPVHGVFTRV